MKKLILLLTIIFFQFSFSQSKEKKFIIFDSSSNSEFKEELGNGKKGIRKTFIKEYKDYGNITFYIGKEMFHFDEKEVDTCKIEYLKKIKISDLNILKKEVNNVNPLYPYKVFPNLYLVEKINDSLIVKYKVKWEYYIE